MAVAGITTQDTKEGHPIGWVPAANVLVDDHVGQPLPAQAKTATYGQPPPAAPVPARTLAPLLARLSSIHGVESVITVRAGGKPALPRTLLGGGVNGLPSAFQETGPLPAGLVSCSQLARAPGLGRCPAGATAVSFPKFLDAGPPAKSLARITWPAVDIPAARLGRLGLDSIDVATNGSQSAVEQARTTLEHANPAFSTPLTLGETATNLTKVAGAYQQLVNVVILDRKSVV